ncbi:DUF1800 domain-containing protein [Sphingobium sp. EM0848]|uniref:DUF1800 domain-containing protein n=1 Tax=Sphingobium sp. EM0848 TaxID=2743473 RepID=UPI00159C808C|nr:DUF1800 domain-containing protein [Sphingobium sp. EM0848]
MLVPLILGGTVASANGSDVARPEIDQEQIAAANRASWGINMASLDASHPDEEPSAAEADRMLPAAAAEQMAAMRITREPLTQLAIEMNAQQKAANALTDPTQKQAARQAWQQAMNDLAHESATRSILRDLYSPAQLREQMTWFWFNHFNVHASKRDIRAMVGDYEDHIRSHALGRFRDLLETTLRHPAMLRYLDNDQNAVGHINENYAREIMELHSMGVGSGYTQKDVQELARILTGVGVSLNPDPPRLKPVLQPLLIREGLFEFNPNRHDFGPKQFLGHAIEGSGFHEVEQALDLIAASPATAHHVSSQIAIYFMGDNPPPPLVDRMATAWRSSDGDISTVLRTLFQSHEYRASLGQTFKDPVHYVISAVRYAYDGRVILNADPMINWLNRMGEGLYNHETPDGYPMSASAWTGPGQMETRFEIARTIGNGAAGLFRPRGPGTADRPAFPQLQNALYYDGLAQTLSPATRTVLDQANSPQQWNMLFLASPDFMRR